MAGRTYSTDALRIPLSISWVPALKDEFHTSEEHPGALSFFHHPVLGGNFDLEMSFNASYRINCDSGQFLSLLSLEFTYHG